jgi:hypothetical protein
LNIPSKVKIGGKIYEVSFTNLTSGSNKIYGGQSAIFRHWIKIQCDMPQAQKEETFLHEMIELIGEMNDLQLNHTQVSTLSNSLYQVIVDNEEIFRSEK